MAGLLSGGPRQEEMVALDLETTGPHFGDLWPHFGILFIK